MVYHDVEQALLELTAPGARSRARAAETPPHSRVPARAKRAVATGDAYYKGIEHDFILNFETIAVTTPDVDSWQQQVQPTDLPELLREGSNRNLITIVREALRGDLRVHCNCPAYLYWGYQWMRTRAGEALEPEDRPPNIRNPGREGSVCKHLFAIMQAMPFFAGDITHDLRENNRDLSRLALRALTGWVRSRRPESVQKAVKLLEQEIPLEDFRKGAVYSLRSNGAQIAGTLEKSLGVPVVGVWIIGSVLDPERFGEGSSIDVGARVDAPIEPQRLHVPVGGDYGVAEVSLFVGEDPPGPKEKIYPLPEQTSAQQAVEVLEQDRPSPDDIEFRRHQEPKPVRKGVGRKRRSKRSQVINGLQWWQRIVKALGERAGLSPGDIDILADRTRNNIDREEHNYAQRLARPLYRGFDQYALGLVLCDTVDEFMNKCMMAPSLQSMARIALKELYDEGVIVKEFPWGVFPESGSIADGLLEQDRPSPDDIEIRGPRPVEVYVSVDASNGSDASNKFQALAASHAWDVLSYGHVRPRTAGSGQWIAIFKVSDPRIHTAEYAKLGGLLRQVEPSSRFQLWDYDPLTEAGRFKDLAVGATLGLASLTGVPETPVEEPVAVEKPAEQRVSVNQLMDAIEWKESKGDPKAVGDEGASKGSMQIQEPYWRDAVEKLKWEKNPVAEKLDYNRDVWNRDKSRIVVQAYWRRYCPDALGQMDAERLSRIHNGGPRGDKKEATKPYWEDIKRILRTRKEDVERAVSLLEQDELPSPEDIEPYWAGQPEGPAGEWDVVRDSDWHNLEGSSFKAYILVAPAMLVREFGPPLEGEHYKLSGHYIFKRGDDAFVNLYDYKDTSLYDPGLPSPEDFWQSFVPQQFHVGSKGGGIAPSFIQWFCNRVPGARPGRPTHWLESALSVLEQDRPSPDDIEVFWGAEGEGPISEWTLLPGRAPVEGTSFKVGLVVSPAVLVREFGSPPVEGDEYKVSGEYHFIRTSDRAVSLVYDYKRTNLYDPDLPSPEEFWQGTTPVEFSVGGKGRGIVPDFVRWFLDRIPEAYIGSERRWFLL